VAMLLPQPADPVSKFSDYFVLFTSVKFIAIRPLSSKFENDRTFQNSNPGVLPPEISFTITEERLLRPHAHFTA
jgi:hypothetical protein